MEIEQLRTLLAVLEHGTFTRAAEAIHASQSTVSFHVRSLEDAVGARLLDRRRGGVRPTPAGRVVASYAQRIVTLRAEALAKVGAETSGDAGRLAIAASTIPAEHLLPAALAQLRRSHPRVSVELSVTDSADAIRALRAGETELAFVGSRVADRRVVYSAFADDEVVLVTGTGGRSETTISALRGIPLVVRPEGSGTRAAVAALLAKLGTSEAPRIQVGTTEAVKRCVLAGLGMSFVSRRSVAEEIATRRIRVVALAGTPVVRKFFVARLRGAELSSAGAALLRIAMDGGTRSTGSASRPSPAAG